MSHPQQVHGTARDIERGGLPHSKGSFLRTVPPYGRSCATPGFQLMGGFMAQAAGPPDRKTGREAGHGPVSCPYSFSNRPGASGKGIRSLNVPPSSPLSPSPKPGAPLRCRSGAAQPVYTGHYGDPRGRGRRQRGPSRACGRQGSVPPPGR